MKDVVILGAGMAGLGAAYRLRQEGVSSVLFDKLDYHGGHAASFIHPEGFIFDDGPHISFTQDERIRELFAASVDGEFEAFNARVDNYWQGYWIKHPAQCNLYGLPEDLVVQVMLEFVAAQHAAEPEIRNYADWLYASYGRTFAETFPMCYTRKFHTTAAENLGTDWLGPRLYRPKLEEVFRGAIAATTEDVHYVSHFRYPTRDGFAGYLKGFVSQSDVRLQHEVTAIDPVRREVRFRSGATAPYAHLISSLPLPELLPLIQGAPQEVRDAAGRLAATECVTVNIGLDREDVHDAHWTYFYDEDIYFTRLSFPHLYSPSNAPAGAGSIQAEVYFSRKYKPRDVILGISAFYHDSAAALVVDGEIVAAAQEERFTRRKHDPGFPSCADPVLPGAGRHQTAEIDHVAFYEKPFVKFERLLETYLAYAPDGFASFRAAMPLWAGLKLDLPERIQRGVWPGFKGEIHFADHHESHAASAFFPSPFDEAAVLTLDAVGEWSTSSVGLGRGNRIALSREMRFPHSLGMLYTAFTYYTGFKVNSGEYKLMGLAPYGVPRYADVIREKIVEHHGRRLGEVGYVVLQLPARA
jgi:protoporphyrinogen oxidase